MSKFIFISFPNEAKAYEATRALENLHADGSLTLYGMAVVAKGQDGKLIVKQESDRGPMGIVIASLVGGLIGLFGGPVGVAVGVSTGALLGSLSDLSNLGVSGEFLDTVATDLIPGKVALIAEVSEEWITPLNEQMSQLGGIVHRTWRSAVEDELGQREMASAKAELSQLKSEYDHAKSESRAKLQIRIAEVEAKAHTTTERLRAGLNRLKQETESKLELLQAQAAKATSEAKARIDHRITELRADGERRSHELNQAWGFAKKAFSS